jgi:hypothetical protein
MRMGAARTRLLVVAAVLITIITGCAGSTGTSSSGSCAAGLTFHGQRYSGSSLRTHPPYDRTARINAAHLHEIGTAVIPACRDTNHSTDQPMSVRVARIDGVDPGTAIAGYPDGSVYVKELSLPVINAVLKSARGIRWDYSG